MRETGKALLVGLLTIALGYGVPAKAHGAEAPDLVTTSYHQGMEQERKFADYAASISDDMLTDLNSDAWRSALNLVCPDMHWAASNDPLEAWAVHHFDTSGRAATAFGYDLTPPTPTDINSASNRSIAIEGVLRHLRPVWHAYNRAKHEQAVHLRSIATAAGNADVICTQPPPSSDSP